MQQVIINARINKDDKDDFVRLCDDIGVTVSTAINMFVRQSLRDQRLPLDLSVEKNSNELSIRNTTAEPTVKAVEEGVRPIPEVKDKETQKLIDSLYESLEDYI